jgi:hypothetical protein
VGNNVIGTKFEGHVHVLVSVKGCFELHVFDIGTTEFGAWGANHTVHLIFADTMLAVWVGSSYG